MAKNKFMANDIEITVLDGYFSNRQPVFQDMTHTIEEKKTTQQIQDDLISTLKISDEVIVDYMIQHDFLLVQDEDGNPIWQMWRMK